MEASGFIMINKMLLTDILPQIFANKLMDDNRIDDPLFTFKVPMPGDVASCSLLAPDFVFYFQLVVS